MSSVVAATKALAGSKLPSATQSRAQCLLKTSPALLSSSSSNASGRSAGTRKRTLSGTRLNDAPDSPLPSPSFRESTSRRSLSPSLENKRHADTDGLNIIALTSVPPPSVSGLEWANLNWNLPVVYAESGDTSISESRLRLVNRILGRAQSGVVFLAEYDSVHYALKCRSKREMSELPQRIPILTSPLIAAIRFIFHDASKICCLTQYVGGVTLASYVAVMPSKIPIGFLKLAFAQVIVAAEALASSRVRLGSFSSSNVLIDENAQIRLLVNNFDLQVSDKSNVWLLLGEFFRSVLDAVPALLKADPSLADLKASNLRSLAHLRSLPTFAGVNWTALSSCMLPIPYPIPVGGLDMPDRSIAATLVAPEAPNQLEGFTIVNAMPQVNTILKHG